MKSNSLKVQIWKYLSIFSIFILSFLWLFQVLFLNKFYEFSKIKQLDNTINLIKESYNNNSLYSNVDNYAEDNGICIQIFTDKKILDVGKTIVKINNQDVYMYDKERLLVEIIRKRKQMPFDYYKEIISNYREIADEIDMSLLADYLDCFTNGKRIFEIIHREVF